MFTVMSIKPAFTEKYDFYYKVVTDNYEQAIREQHKLIDGVNEDRAKKQAVLVDLHLFPIKFVILYGKYNDGKFLIQDDDVLLDPLDPTFDFIVRNRAFYFIASDVGKDLKKAIEEHGGQCYTSEDNEDVVEVAKNAGIFDNTGETIGEKLTYGIEKLIYRKTTNNVIRYLNKKLSRWS